MGTATTNPKSFPVLAIGLAVLYWIIESFLDVYIFSNQASFAKSLFTSDANELWMRFSVITILILFSLYAKRSEQINSALQKEVNSKSDAENELEFLETVDPLTLLFNKRKLYELLEYEMDKDKRYKAGLSIIYCSIDNYNKIIADNNHDITDDLLRNVALQLVESLRTSDIVARWTEDEFLILIPNKNAEETKMVAEKIRKVIEDNIFEEVGKITASFGVTQFIDDDNKVTIVNRANDALIKAQESGKNCVQIVN